MDKLTTSKSGEDFASVLLQLRCQSFCQIIIIVSAARRTNIIFIRTVLFSRWCKTCTLRNISYTEFYQVIPHVWKFDPTSGVQGVLSLNCCKVHLHWWNASATRVVRVQIYHSMWTNSFQNGFAVDHGKSFPLMNFEFSWIFIVTPELMISFPDLILHTKCLVELLESQVTLRLAALFAHLPLQEAS